MGTWPTGLKLQILLKNNKPQMMEILLIKLWAKIEDSS